MSEGDVAFVGATSVVSKPKRVRVKKVVNPDLLKGPGVATAGKWFVCSYCGGTSPKALVPADVIKGVAYDTYPCGLAWIAANAQSDTARTAATDGFTKLYGQPPGQVLPAPDTAQLVQFGGPLTQEQWLPNYNLWQALTEAVGVDTSSIATKSRTKKPAAATGAVTFEVGVYLIPIKGPAKRVTAVDGVGELKPPKGSLTYVGAMRKLNKWIAANAGFTVAHFDTERYSVSAATSVLATPDTVNNTATQLAGSNVSGPALAIFTRKVSVKV